MTFSISRFARTATPAKTAAAATQPTRRGPVELQPQQLSQVAGGLPKGGWIKPESSPTSLI